MQEQSKFLLVKNLIVLVLALRLSIEEHIGSGIRTEDFGLYPKAVGCDFLDDLIDFHLLRGICIAIKNGSADLIDPDHGYVVDVSIVVVRHLKDAL